MPPMPKILVNFEPSQVNWLRKEAKRLHIPVNDLVRRLVAVHVPSTAPKSEPAPVDPSKPIYETMIVSKHSYDGCTSLSEILSRHQQGEQFMKGLLKDGVQVEGVVDNGWTVLVTNDPKIAKKHRMTKREIEE